MPIYPANLQVPIETLQLPRRAQQPSKWFLPVPSPQNSGKFEAILKSFGRIFTQVAFISALLLLLAWKRKIMKQGDFKFFVSNENQFFHHHAGPILKDIQYRGESFREILVQSLNAICRIPLSQRKERGIERLGVRAQNVNDELRRHMGIVFGDDVLFEVKERTGYWEWGLKKEGFDFAIINHLNNLVRLWNVCFGERPIYRGEKLWESKIQDSDLYGRLVQQNAGMFSDFKHGENAPLPTPLDLPILGEIQFGNHALRGVDMFRLMRAHRTSQIGLIVYVAPTGKLESLLSSGIVTFDVMRDFLQEFDKEINVPIWLLGLDCEVEFVPNMNN